MNNYESVFIATPVLSDQQLEELAGKFRGVITENGGQIVNEEAWGLKNSRILFRRRPPDTISSSNLRVKVPS